MSIHINFADGSNPWVAYNLSVTEAARVLLKWSRRFELVLDSTAGTILFFTATEKTQKTK